MQQSIPRRLHSRIKKTLENPLYSSAEKVDLIARIVDDGAPSDVQGFYPVLSGLTTALTQVKNTLQNAPPNRVPVYEKYRDLLVATRAQIEELMLGDADNPNPPLSYFTKKVAEENAARARDNLPPNVKWTKHWSSWVKPKAAKEMLDAFEALYNSPEELGRPATRRILPFESYSERTVRRLGLKNLEEAPKRIKDEYDRKVHNSVQTDVLPTNYEKEVYRAACTALKIIDRMRKVYPRGYVLPTHWQELLEAPERKVLRDAEFAPGANDPVTPRKAAS